MQGQIRAGYMDDISSFFCKNYNFTAETARNNDRLIGLLLAGIASLALSSLFIMVAEKQKSTTANIINEHATHDFTIFFVHADWCKPCQAAKPIVAQIKQEIEKTNAGRRLTIVEVNAKNCQEILGFEPSAVPFFILYENGKRTQRFHRGKFSTPDDFKKKIKEWTNVDF